MDAGVKRLTQRSANLPETLLQLSHEDVYVAGQKTNPRGNQYKQTEGHNLPGRNGFQCQLKNARERHLVQCPVLW